jgi:hypothetical protein
MLISLSRAIIFITTGLWLAFTLWTTFLVMGNNTQIYAENGLLENIQACILVIAFAVYLVNAAIEKRPGKLIPLFFSLLCYSFLLRELNIETFDIPYPLQFIGSGSGRDISLAIAFFAVFFYAATNYSFYRKAVISHLKTRAGWLLIVAGVLLVVGASFEDYHSITHHIFIEEKLELFAYILILFSSIMTNSYTNSVKINPVG